MEPSPESSPISAKPPRLEDSPAAVIDAEIDARLSEIASLNRKIHDHPELAYEEHKAHDAFVTHLRFLNFDVTPRAYGLDTAFSAEYGSGGRLVVFNAEYDALPGIGHACGHNLIASASFAAFLGLAAALRRAGRPGRVRLLGTPAEEGGGGKLKLLAAGAYEGAAASLMVHPAGGHGLGRISSPASSSSSSSSSSSPAAGPRGVAVVRMLANVKMRVHFAGREAHAAIAPWDGVNALDAVCLSYNAVSMLRQQIRPHERIHGVFREAGDRPNVTPARCCVEYYVRSDTRAAAWRLWERVKRCFEGAALATGCDMTVEPLNSYADLRPNPSLCRAYVDAMPPGAVLYESPVDVLAGSTDMGDVTYACPGFHGAFAIETEEGAVNHTKGFAAAAGTEDAFRRAVECGRAMALVGWRVLTDDGFAAAMTKEWEEDIRRAG